jgi:hypothetical protein
MIKIVDKYKTFLTGENNTMVDCLKSTEEIIKKELLKKAFEAGRDYEYSINPYSGKPNNNKVISFTKWYNKFVKK